jgi:hypothetical protein
MIKDSKKRDTGKKRCILDIGEFSSIIKYFIHFIIFLFMRPGEFGNDFFFLINKH